MKKIYTIDSFPFEGDFMMIEQGTGHVLHDSHIDGGDVSPLLVLAPLVSIKFEQSGLIVFTVSTDLHYLKEGQA